MRTNCICKVSVLGVLKGVLVMQLPKTFLCSKWLYIEEVNGYMCMPVCPLWATIDLGSNENAASSRQVQCTVMCTYTYLSVCLATV